MLFILVTLNPFTKTVIFDDTDAESYAITLADMDLDNDLDIIIANSESANMIYFNEENSKKWTAHQLKNESFDTYDIITADLNNDGRQDIIEANSDAINRYYFNRLKK